MRQLCGTVLIMEAIIVGLAIAPAIALEHVHGSTAGAVGGGIAVVAIVLAGLVGRPRMGWALYAGSALQVMVIVSGIVMPAMYVLGVIFAAFWFTGIWLARKVERRPPPHSGQDARVAGSPVSRSGLADRLHAGPPSPFGGPGFGVRDSRSFTRRSAAPFGGPGPRSRDSRIVNT